MSCGGEEPVGVEAEHVEWGGFAIAGEVGVFRGGEKDGVIAEGGEDVVDFGRRHCVP